MPIPDVTCPVCSSDRSIVIAAHLYRCRTCGSAFNVAHESKSYSDSYFLDEYRAQYGKTYLEDHDTIYRLAVKRLSTILRYAFPGTPRDRLSLLDIGSAAGFFLESARDTGIGTVTGVEISDFAARYCREELHLPVIRGAFTDVNLEGHFNIITAWYFIEHCLNPAEVVHRIFELLAEGGVFACSVPSLFGPLYTLHRDSWIATHPRDHRVDFTPRSLRRLLVRTGFRKIQIASAGFHPSRVLSPGSPLLGLFSPMYSIFSRLTAFSDTLEAYAIK